MSTEQQVSEPAERVKHATLAAALVAAQAAAKSVGKDATNKYHGYNYASAEAIMAEAREALNSAGLAVIMVEWTLTPPATATKELSQAEARVWGDLANASCLFRVVHADSAETMETRVGYPVIPEKGRPADKALATALTYTTGYYLRGLLCLPRIAEDEDVDQRDDRERQQPRRSNDRPRNQSENKPAGSSNGSGSKPPQDVVKTWEAKVTTCTSPSTLRTMASSLRENTKMPEADRTRLADMAERKATQLDAATAKVGAER